MKIPQTIVRHSTMVVREYFFNIKRCGIFINLKAYNACRISHLTSWSYVKLFLHLKVCFIKFIIQNCITWSLTKTFIFYLLLNCKEIIGEQQSRENHIYSIHSQCDIHLPLTIMTSFFEYCDVRCCTQIETCNYVIKRLISFIFKVIFMYHPVPGHHRTM